MAVSQQSTGWAVVSPDTGYTAYAELLTSGNLTTADGAHGLGYTPAPVHVSGTEDTASVRPLYRMMVSYPSTYDLRLLGRVTPARDQGSAGTCWAFAAYGSLESYLMPGENRDFSESNMKNLAGFDQDPNTGGGDMWMAMAYLLRWDGPVNETDDPYVYPYSKISPSGLTIQKHVQDVIMLPSRTGPLDNDAIKTAVTNYGGIWANMYWKDSSYNPAHASFYYDSGMGAPDGGHAVTIVGWDDNYDRNKFNAIPPGNGAFIVKNSWGTAWGDGGYFYVSYYDSAFAGDCAVFTAEPSDNYDNIYQYDSLGWTVSINASGSDVAWFRNDFTLASDETLIAVGFYVPEERSAFDICVYDGATLVSSTTGIYSPSMGYHTFQLDSPVAFHSGDHMSVVVRANGPDTGYTHICAEMPFSGYSGGAIANDSEGFISTDGVTWDDVNVRFPGTSVCLKAYTVDTCDIPVSFAQASYEVDEDAGAVTITLQKSGSGYASVSYATGGGNATAGTNYATSSGTVVFGASETVKSFTVPILDDGVYAHQKVFYVSLTGLVNANVATASVPVYINDADSPPILYIEAISGPVYDNAGTVTVNVSKAGGTEFDASMAYLTLNGTAKSGLDFINASGILTFAPGEMRKTISITVLPDSEYEADATFNVLLSNPVNATLNSSQTRPVTITTSVPHTHIELLPEWNLICIPLLNKSNNLSDIFPDEVLNNITDIWGWNESEQNWLYYSCNPDDYFYQFYPKITALDTGRAYWVRSNASASIILIGTVPEYAPNSSVSLVEGWNFVGITGTSLYTLESLYPNATDIWGWDESKQNWVYHSIDPDDYFYHYYPELHNLVPGHGYWVRME